MTFAWIENNTVRDVCEGAPQHLFAPEVAALYSTEVPAGTKPGYVLIKGNWVAPPPPPTPVPEPVAIPPKVSPVEFLLLFTPQERVAIRAARPNDPVLDDFFGIVEDPRLTFVNLALPSVQDALHYLVANQFITDARREEILKGAIV